MFDFKYRIIFFLFFFLFFFLKKYFLFYNIIYIFFILNLILFFILIIYNLFYNIYILKNHERSYSIWIKNISRLNFLYKNNFLFKKLIFNLCFNKICIPPVNFDKLFFFTKNKKIIYSLINDINLSVDNVYIMFYIWEPNYLSNKIALSLIKASCRGVNCKIILDSIGSRNFFKTMWPIIMNKYGIKIIEYSKFNFFEILSKRVDLRQHKKIILIDDYITYIGSMNLIDSKKFKKYLNLGKWIDLIVKIESIFLNKIIKLIFYYEWELETGNIILEKRKKYTINKIIKNKKLIQVITSGPGLPNNLIHRSLINIIFSTKKRLIITTPYFVPSSFLIDAICTIADKGIEVIIILPKKSDSFLVYWSSRYFFKDLLSCNIKIYLFKKDFLHSKSILVDDNITIIGSINFDMRSIWLNFEIALIIYDNLVNKKLYEIQKKYISQSKLIKFNFWKKRNIYKKFFEKFSHIFYSFL